MPAPIIQNWIDVARSFGKGRFPHRAPNRLLRGMVTIRFALIQSGLSRAGFLAQLQTLSISSDGNIDRSRLEAWIKGEQMLQSRSIVEGIDTLVPGTLHMYDHPVFQLLENRRLTPREIDRLLKPYRAAVPDRKVIIESLEAMMQKHPDNDFVRGLMKYARTTKSINTFIENTFWCAYWDYDGKVDRHYRYQPIFDRNYTEGLLHWRGIEGFTIILGLVREADANHDTHSHITRMADLYRSLPTVLAIPWFRLCQIDLCKCVGEIHQRDRLSSAIVKPNWRAIHSLSLKNMQQKMPTFSDSHQFWTKWRNEVAPEDDVVQVVYPLRAKFIGDHERDYFHRC